MNLSPADISILMNSGNTLEWQPRADSITTFDAYLIEKIRETYEQVLPPTWTDTFIPTETNLPMTSIGLNKMMWTQSAIRGQFATHVTSYVTETTDFPTLSHTYEKETASSSLSVLGHVWNKTAIDQERAAQALGLLDKTTVEMATLSARKLYEQELHNLALYGFSENPLPLGTNHYHALLDPVNASMALTEANTPTAPYTGVTTRSGYTVKGIYVGSATTPTTSSAIYKALANEINAFAIDNSLSMGEIKVLTGTDARTLLNEGYRLTSNLESSSSLQGVLTDTTRSIYAGSIDYKEELNITSLVARGQYANNAAIAAAGATDNYYRFILCSPMADRIKRRILPLTYGEPRQQDDFNFKQVFWFGSSELLMPETRFIRYVDLKLENYPTGA